MSDWLPLPFRGEGWGEGNWGEVAFTGPSPAFAALGTLSPEGEREVSVSAQILRFSMQDQRVAAMRGPDGVAADDAPALGAPFPLIDIFAV